MFETTPQRRFKTNHRLLPSAPTSASIRGRRPSSSRRTRPRQSGVFSISAWLGPRRAVTSSESVLASPLGRSLRAPSTRTTSSTRWMVLASLEASSTCRKMHAPSLITSPCLAAMTRRGPSPRLWRVAMVRVPRLQTTRSPHCLRQGAPSLSLSNVRTKSRPLRLMGQARASHSSVSTHPSRTATSTKLSSRLRGRAPQPSRSTAARGKSITLR